MFGGVCRLCGQKEARARNTPERWRTRRLSNGLVRARARPRRCEMGSRFAGAQYFQPPRSGLGGLGGPMKLMKRRARGFARTRAGDLRSPIISVPRARSSRRRLRCAVRVRRWSPIDVGEHPTRFGAASSAAAAAAARINDNHLGSVS